MKPKAAVPEAKRKAERLRLWFTGDGPGKLTLTANLMLTAKLTLTANLMLTANPMLTDQSDAASVRFRLPTGLPGTVMAEKNSLLLHFIVGAGGYFWVVSTGGTNI
ncbi:hypothetical protein [Paenibacillus jilunlii]|nr:hypothetical protein [Paenibacillus jilunlii]